MAGSLRPARDGVEVRFSHEVQCPVGVDGRGADRRVCVHRVQGLLVRTVGEDVKLIDSGEATALEVTTLLKEKNLARLTPPTGALDRQLCDDLDHFYVTDAAERFARVAERFLGATPARLEAVEVWGSDELTAD